MNVPCPPPIFDKIGLLNEFTTATVQQQKSLSGLVGEDRRQLCLAGTELPQSQPHLDGLLNALQFSGRQTPGLVAQALFADRGELVGQGLTRTVISIEPT